MKNIVLSIQEFLQSMGFKALEMLPDSPFLSFLNAMEQMTWLKWLNWVIPIGNFVAILEAWLPCVVVFYSLQLILRWARAIE